MQKIEEGKTYDCNNRYDFKASVKWIKDNWVCIDEIFKRDEETTITEKVIEISELQEMVDEKIKKTKEMEDSKKQTRAVYKLNRPDMYCRIEENSKSGKLPENGKSITYQTDDLYMQRVIGGFDTREFCKPGSRGAMFGEDLVFERNINITYRSGSKWYNSPGESLIIEVDLDETSHAEVNEKEDGELTLRYIGGENNSWGHYPLKDKYPSNIITKDVRTIVESKLQNIIDTIGNFLNVPDLSGNRDNTKFMSQSGMYGLIIEDWTEVEEARLNCLRFIVFNLYDKNRYKIDSTAKTMPIGKPKNWSVLFDKITSGFNTVVDKWEAQTIDIERDNWKKLVEEHNG